MPSQISGTLGSKLFITDTAMAAAIDTEFEFMAQSYTEIGLIENLGELGRVFDPVTFQAIADGRTYKLKGGYNDGQMQMTLGQDLTDAGQDILYDAANASSQDNYGFKLEMNDEATTSGGPTTFYFRGLAMSFRTQMGAVNSVVRSMSTIEINSPIIMTPPAELYDRFVTGGSLAGYALFDGTDPQAIAPVITSNALVGVTGDAGTGYAADGTQAIYTTGFTLSGGALVFECKVKISAITNVAMFVGLTDQIAVIEVPIESAAVADTITTNATDAVGFMFDTSMATDNIWFVGVNNNIDETSINSALAFVADTYRVLRMEITTGGNVVFYIDGAVVGTTMTTAVATGVALYPTIIAAARSTASRTITADYLYTRQD